MTTFFDLPIEKTSVRPYLIDIANKLGLVINKYMDSKIEWSETHGGRCMCDWENRKCPCNQIMEDIRIYNGQCLCKVLVTEQKMASIEANILKKNDKKQTKIISNESKKKSKQKTKEAKLLAKKIGCKKCK